jgi:hypothetical protein
MSLCSAIEGQLITAEHLSERLEAQEPGHITDWLLVDAEYAALLPTIRDFLGLHWLPEYLPPSDVASLKLFDRFAEGLWDRVKDKQADAERHRIHAVIAARGTDVPGLEAVEIVSSRIALEDACVRAGIEYWLPRLLRKMLEAVRGLERRIRARLHEPTSAALDSADETTIPPRNENDDRDRFIYEARTAGTPLKKVESMLKAHPDWDPLNGESGIRKACDAYAERHQLPKVRGTRGRPKKNRTSGAAN